MNWFTVRKPRLRINRSGARITPPSFRFGSRKAGINVSESGVSETVGGKGWSFNTRRGFSFGIPCLPMVVILFAGTLCAFARTLL